MLCISTKICPHIPSSVKIGQRKTLYIKIQTRICVRNTMKCLRQCQTFWTDIVTANETHFQDNQINRRMDTLCQSFSKIGLATETFLRRKLFCVNTITGPQISLTVINMVEGRQQGNILQLHVFRKEISCIYEKRSLKTVSVIF